MKKRLLSMLLAMCLVVGMLPVFTMRSDAIIGSIIKAGLTVCKSVVNGTIQTVKHADHYNGDIGKAVLGQFKNIGADLTGLDIGEDYGEGGSGDNQVVVNVSMEEVENQLKTINAALEKNEIAINQLSSTVTAGVSSISKQLSELSKQLQDSTDTLKYYTYLNEFFVFFNQYYEALSYYDKAASSVLASDASDELVKNTFDQFYHLENVEYTGSLHSAVEKLGKYLRGEYLTSDAGGAVDALSRYYILAYKQQGKSEAEAEKLAAQATEEMIAHIYYAYCMGVHFEESVTLYQITYMKEHDASEYVTDFGTRLSKQHLTDQINVVMENTPVTAGYIFGALLDNYTMQSFDMAYCSVYDYDTQIPQVPSGSSYWYSRTVSFADGFKVNPGSYFYLPDASICLSSDFSEELRESFAGICTYASSSDQLTLNGAKVSVKSCDADGSSWTKDCPIDLVVSGHTVKTLKVTVNQIEYTDRKGWDGDGTEDYPYLVTNAHFLTRMRNSGAYHVLAGDLDFTGSFANFALFSGAHYSINNFFGVFDGNGHTIKGLVIDNKYERSLCGDLEGWDKSSDTRKQMYGLGLFGNLYGTVLNLNIRNFKIDFKTTLSSHSDFYAGVIAGYVCGGEIIRCNVYDSSVNVDVTCPDGANGYSNYTNMFIGGIAGGVFGGNGASITYCTFEDDHSEGYLYGNLEATPRGLCPGYTGVGGIVGVIGRDSDNETRHARKFPMLTIPETNTGTVDCCQVHMDWVEEDPRFHFKIYGGQQNWGGLVGRLQNGELKDSWYSGYFEVLGRSDTNSGATRGRIVGSTTDPGKITGDLVTIKCPGDDAKWINGLRACGSHDNSELAAKYTELNEHLDEDLFEDYVLPARICHAYTYDFNVDHGAHLKSGDYNNDFNKLPLKTEYCAGEYIDLTGLALYVLGTYTYQNLGRSEGFTFSEESLELINNPLTAGKHKIVVYTGGGVSTEVKFEIKVSDHVYYGETVEATCTENGHDSWICLDCGDTKYEEFLAHGHRTLHLVLAVDPTCTTAGTTGGTYCRDCGKAVVEETILPALGHDHTIEKGYAATCTEAGLSDKDYCSVCGEVNSEAKAIPALGHDYKDVVTPPTSTEKGYTTHTCTACGDSYVDSYVDPYVLGDANDDGFVTLADVTLLMKYLAGWDVTINEVNSDANVDGKVNLADVTLIMKYLANWDVTFG